MPDVAIFHTADEQPTKALPSLFPSLKDHAEQFIIADVEYKR